MDLLSDFFPIMHKESGYFLAIDNVSTRIGGEMPLCLSPTTRSWRSFEAKSEKGIMWKFVANKFVPSNCESLVLTAKYIKDPKDTLSVGKKVWDLSVCGFGGSVHDDVEQRWIVRADGTIRMFGNDKLCLGKGGSLPNGSTGCLVNVLEYDKAQHSELIWMIGFSNDISVSMEDRYLGCLLGLTVGDALGFAHEGWTSNEIELVYPSGVRDLYGRKNIKNEEHEMEPGSYTNRSTFALAVATSLIEMRDSVPGHISQRCAEFYAVKVIQGHGRLFGTDGESLTQYIRDRSGRCQVAESDEFDPRRVTTDGSSSVYRVPSVGLAWRSLSDSELRDKVLKSVISSDGDYDAAFMVAKAIALIADGPGPSQFDIRKFLSQLARSMQNVVKKPFSRSRKLSSNVHSGFQTVEEAENRISDAPTTWYVDCIYKILHLLDLAEDMSYTELREKEESAGLRHSSAIPFACRAIDTVPTALWNFAIRWGTPRECLIWATHAGGDTTTSVSILGAFLGALHGPSWISKSWFETLNNGIHGRDYIIETALQLFTVYH